ncbi:hypothetical protein psal_cds_1331 [Pandoravirus salinus]|uniref:F-box domain containing protein n=1 Tax=Pandoravirus salinus TaxID=1349410 RepID=S4W4R6_9VIRU|nr:hypothetical protein psal_cds_1331 [Pandoravirus salinus]AGO85717.1 hypothetical protein psal_cds_1331 [Pandoravirus salinus]
MASLDDLSDDILYFILNGHSFSTGNLYVPCALRFSVAAVSSKWRRIVSHPTVKDSQRIRASVYDPHHAQAIVEGRGVAASGVAMMAALADSDPQATWDAACRLCDCPWFELAPAMAASNTLRAVSWALDVVDDPSRVCPDDNHFSCRHIHPNRQWRGRCSILLSAARADAPLTIDYIARGSQRFRTLGPKAARYSSECFRTAGIEAAQRGNVAALRAILQFDVGMALCLWKAVGTHGHLGVAELLLEMERRSDKFDLCLARVGSGWQDISAANGVIKAIDIMKRLGIGINGPDLFDEALRHARFKFCEALIDAYPQLALQLPSMLCSWLDWPRFSELGRFDSDALAWLVSRPWFDPTPAEVAKIVAHRYRWSHRDLVTLAARWPDRDLVLCDGTTLCHHSL